jgi:hypothetical protein
MTHRTLLAAAAAALSLSACNQNKEPQEVGGPVDPMANEVANAAPPALLPSIAATKKYRCNPGNELVSIDWTELNGAPAGANLRVGDAAAPTVLSAAAEGKGFTAPDGTTLDGTKDAATVSLTLPGKGKLSCKA